MMDGFCLIKTRACRERYETRRKHPKCCVKTLQLLVSFIDARRERHTTKRKRSKMFVTTAVCIERIAIAAKHVMSSWCHSCSRKSNTYIMVVVWHKRGTTREKPKASLTSSGEGPCIGQPSPVRCENSQKSIQKHLLTNKRSKCFG